MSDMTSVRRRTLAAIHFGLPLTGIAVRTALPQMEEEELIRTERGAWKLTTEGTQALAAVFRDDATQDAAAEHADAVALEMSAHRRLEDARAAHGRAVARLAKAEAALLEARA